jgi:hypothetical protein
MAKAERKFKGSASLGQLERNLERDEALFGKLTKLEALLDHSVGTFDNSEYVPASSLGLLPSIGGQAPPASPSSRHLFDGEAVVLGVKMQISVYRQS